MERNLHAYSLIKTLFVLIALATPACHREVALPPLPLSNITLTDKFFDVWPTSPTRAVVVVDRGVEAKLVMGRRDSSKSWERLNSRANLFIFGLSFPGALHGFFVGDRAL